MTVFRIIIGAAALTMARAVPPPTTAAAPTVGDRILVFSKTTGFRHESIEAGVIAITTLAEHVGIAVEATEDAAAFTREHLETFDAVVWLSTTGDVLDADQQAAFETYVEGGGGFAGIHAAADTEYDWPWYGELVGARFDHHPDPQEADVVVEDHTHPSTATLGSTWRRFDEWYSFRTNPRPDVHVLMTLDERTYTGGGMGSDHPIAWTHLVGEGRAWYTALGHTAESYGEPRFLDHVLGGIRSVMRTSTSSDHDSDALRVILAGLGALVVLGGTATFLLRRALR